MGKKRILIAETCTEFGASLSRALEADYDVQMCYNEATVREFMETHETDGLVLDLGLTGMNGLSLLKWISQQPHRPHILVLSTFMSQQLEMDLADLKVDMVAMLPCHVDFLAEEIMDMLPAKMPLLHLRTSTSISTILLELDMPPHRWGYTYLEEAIDLYLMYPTQTLTKFIYPQIASKYNSTPKAVERAIRKLIRDTYEKGYNQKWGVYFSHSKEGVIPLPTNAYFIARIAKQYEQSHCKQP
jgi:two-component system response regulator (stage 0 sporulation protein A)